ncbi:MAG TPA: hypothetical protein VGQ24_03820 [Gemmatimonadales bacterium]|nr:hypothetical protein [Gemmatimonadales bacterium]
MTCPKCGAEMNRHAEKLVYPESAAEARRADPVLGGLIEETHACPACGNVVARRV